MNGYMPCQQTVAWWYSRWDSNALSKPAQTATTATTNQTTTINQTIKQTNKQAPTILTSHNRTTHTDSMRHVATQGWTRHRITRSPANPKSCPRLSSRQDDSSGAQCHVTILHKTDQHCRCFSQISEILRDHLIFFFGIRDIQ